MKKVMILGASIYQVPLIKTAKDCGYYTIVVSIPGDYPGFILADKVFYVDTADYKTICEIAKAEKIDAIVTTGTDVALISVGYVCDELGLKGISFESARVSTNKMLMKEAMVRGGVSTARHMVVYSIDEAYKAAEAIGYPVILKVIDTSGSRGVTRVNGTEELQEAYSYGMNFTDSDCMIVEKYIEAHEIGIDAFVQDGEVKLFLPHDKLVYTTSRTDIPKGHICPFNLSTKLYDELYVQTCRVVEALSLNDCAVNMDVFITDDDKVFIIEATGRCGATGIPEVISTYLGMDYYKSILKNALGEKVDFSYDKAMGAVASVLVFSDKSGKLLNVFYDEKYSLSLDYSKGQMIRKAENGPDRIGMAILSAETVDELKYEIGYFENSIEIKVEDES